MYFFLTDRNDSDRDDYLIDIFATREAAEAYSRELGYGEVEEVENLKSQIYLQSQEENLANKRYSFQS